MTRTRSGLAGLLAAALAVGTAELAAAILPGSRSPLVVVGDRIITLTPGPVVRWAIDTFGDRNRLVLGLAMTAVMAIVAWLVGAATPRRRWIAPVGFGAVAALGAAAGLADPLVPAAGAILAPLIGAVAGVAGLLWLVRPGEVVATTTQDRVSPGPPTARLDDGPTSDRPTTDRPTTDRPTTRPTTDRPTTDASDHPATHALLGSIDPTRPAPPPRSRREFLVGAVAIAGAAGVFGAVGRAWQSRSAVDEARLGTDLPTPRVTPGPPPAGARLDVDGISPLVTPNEDFYRIDTAFTVPRVDPDTYAIRITGMVDRQVELTYDDLLDLADTEAYVTLSCVSNEVGGGLVGNARWLGVPLDRVLDQARVQPSADQIVGRSVDGWTGGFPVEAAFDGRPALIAVGMNGEPLPIEHGFPARLVIAGLYGYVSDTKWLSEIELTTFDAYDAYWIPRGWARFGPIKTQSRIDVPASGGRLEAGEVVVAGVAWSDERGVSAVEVAVDDGPWQPADLADELATTSWRQWRFVWDATPGEHHLAVRATDADGVTQPAERMPPAPDGATGHHTITVAIT